MNGTLDYIIAVGLAATALACVLAMLILAYSHDTIPATFAGIAGACVGGLAGALQARRQKGE